MFCHSGGSRIRINCFYMWALFAIYGQVISLPLAPDASILSSKGTIEPMRNLVARQVANAAVLRPGWVPQPDGRGTFDHVESFYRHIPVLLECSCLNVPPRRWSPWRWQLQKIFMACLGILGPEFVFQIAIGQWSSAGRSVDAFTQSGYLDWTKKHAFFADMGGFLLHPPDWVPFPLNSKQVHYLVIHGYIPYSAVALEKADLADRNKGDGMVRFISVLQILWFSFNCIARASQGLAITTLELTTLGFILCTLGTSYFWFHKPMDVQKAIS